MLSVPEHEIEGRPCWSLRLFGEFELTELAGGRKIAVPGKRERVLLAYLAVNPNRRELRRKLTKLLWGDDSDKLTLDNLRTSVFNLRKALGPLGHQAISSDGQEIVLDASAFEVDVLEFRRLAASSGSADLQQAARICAGEFLDGLAIESDEFESWRREEAMRCSNRALEVLNALIANAAATGDTERAIEAGHRILRIEPLHEPAIRRLMLLYRDSGRRSAAIELYRNFADRLKTELGAHPEPETRSAFTELGNGAALAAPDVVTTPSPMPATPNIVRAPSAPAVTHLMTRRRQAIALLAAGVVAAAIAVFYATAGFVHSPFATGTPVAAPANIAIAVLPFTNASGDPKQELFTEGLRQEITTALAKIPGLRVVARNLAFQLKGQSQDIGNLAKQFGATHVVRGTVRQQGEWLYVAIQLIRGDDGRTLWTQNYDRDLTEAFAIPNQLAYAIGVSLHAQPSPGEVPATGRAIDSDSYQQYLAAKPLVRARQAGVPQAIDILEPLVARYPDFAPISALLAHAYVYAAAGDEHRTGELWPKAEAAARRAIQSDPGLSEGYYALANLQRVRGKLVDTDDLLRKALALDAENPDALNLQMMNYANVARLKDALAIAERLLVLEPGIPAFKANIGRTFWENGRTAEAIEVLKPVTEFGAVRLSLAMIYAAMGRTTDAADVLGHDGNEQYRARATSVEAAKILRALPAKVPASDTYPPLYLRPIPVDFVYLYGGDPERALESYERVVKFQPGGLGDWFGILWHPSYAAVRKTERFKELMRKAGMVEYWRARGWPEFCNPTTGDDFTCH